VVQATITAGTADHLGTTVVPFFDRQGHESEPAGPSAHRSRSVGRRPATVDAQHGVGGQHVGMQLEVAGPRGPMDEGGGHQARGLDPPLAAGSASGEGSVALEVGQPFGDRSVMGRPDGGRSSGVAQPSEDRDGFGAEKVRSVLNRSWSGFAAGV
jgi:hypothetical protein